MSIFDQIGSAFASDFVSGPTVNPQYQPSQLKESTQPENLKLSNSTELEQPEQEPVAIVQELMGGFVIPMRLGIGQEPKLKVGDKLYITPPQRKPLTEEEMEKIAAEYWLYPRKFVRAIEAAHGITEEKNT